MTVLHKPMRHILGHTYLTWYNLLLKTYLAYHYTGHTHTQRTETLHDLAPRSLAGCPSETTQGAVIKCNSQSPLVGVTSAPWEGGAIHRWFFRSPKTAGHRLPPSLNSSASGDIQPLAPFCSAHGVLLSSSDSLVVLWIELSAPTQELCR